MSKIHCKITKVYLDKGNKTKYRIRPMINGKRICKTFNTITDANSFLNLLSNKGIDGANLIVYKDNINEINYKTYNNFTINEWIINVANNMTFVTKKHKDTTKSIVNYLDNLYNMKISYITQEMIIMWLLTRYKAGDSAKTIRNKHGILSNCFNKAVDEGLIIKNPCQGVKLPRVEKKEMCILELNEYKRFLTFVPMAYRLFVRTLFLTGLRFGEITALKKSDINFSQQTINISKAWTENYTKISIPKTEKSNRIITISPKLSNNLKSHCMNKSNDAFIFTNQFNKPIKNSTFHRQVWDKALKQFNSHKQPRIHDARHTCASWLLSGGVPIHVVSYHLGHTSIETTVKRYGHILSADHLAVAKTLAQYY